MNLVHTVRQTVLVIFFALPVAGLAQLMMIGLESLTGRSSDDLLNSAVATFAAMMIVSTYRDRIFSPSRRLIYLAAAGYVGIGLALWLSMAS
ncbi:MAG: hypothetical protein ACREX3_10130 [Gammaproteobacteria bacterium]